MVSVALAVLFMAGCASDREAQTQSMLAETSLLSVTNAMPGSTYEVRVYVIKAGDTVAMIAHKFGISIANLRAINPGLNPTRIKVGQKIKVYEKRIE